MTDEVATSVTMQDGRPHYDGPPWKQLTPAVRSQRILECFALGFSYPQIAGILKSFNEKGECNKNTISGHVHNYKMTGFRREFANSSREDSEIKAPSPQRNECTASKVSEKKPASAPKIVIEDPPITAHSLPPVSSTSARLCRPIGFCYETVPIRVPGEKATHEFCGEFTGSLKRKRCPRHAALLKKKR